MASPVPACISSREKCARPFLLLSRRIGVRTAGSLALALLGASLFVPAAQAQNANRPFYLRFETGPAFMQETDVDRFLGPSPGLEVEFDPGWHLGVVGGYKFNDWLAAEIHTGASVAYIKGFNTAAIDENDSSYSNFPLLGNVMLQYPCPCGFTPYIGGGAGLSITTLAADDMVAGGSVIDGSSADAGFAYQGFAGLRYRLNERMELGLAYKYFVADSADWDVDVIFGPDSSIAFDSVETHLAAFTFTLEF